jgi:hypothetical protein
MSVLNLNIPDDGETGLCALDPEFITYTGVADMLLIATYVALADEISNLLLFYSSSYIINVLS